MNLYSTEEVSGWLDYCDSIEELKEQILPRLQIQRQQWKEKIEEILLNTGYRQTQFAELCGVSAPSVRKWRNGSLPQSRDMYIRIGFAAGYNLAEMNAFLKRYGRCPQLYIRSLEDSVCMFVLSSSEIEHSYRMYEQLLDIVHRELASADATPVGTYTTIKISQEFLSLERPDEMVQFARNNVLLYRESYHKLYAYIIAYLTVNLEMACWMPGDRKSSFHGVASEEHWSSSLRHCVSEIRNKKWFPRRDKLISLGLHLNMDSDAIDEMLRLAQMAPLYSKNPIEASIRWAINEAKLIADGGDTEGKELLEDLSQFIKGILLQLNLEDSEYLIDDL